MATPKIEELVGGKSNLLGEIIRGRGRTIIPESFMPPSFKIAAREYRKHDWYNLKFNLENTSEGPKA